MTLQENPRAAERACAPSGQMHEGAQGAMGDSAQADGHAGVAARLRDIFAGRNALLILALALSFTSTWLINTAVYPLTNPFAPQTQYLSPIAGALVAFACAFVCQYRPRIFTTGLTVVVALVVTEAMSVLLYLSALWVSAPLAIFAAVVRWVTCILRDMALGFALMSLSAPACAGVLVCGYGLRYVFGLLLTPAALEVKIAAFLLCYPVGLALLWPFAKVSFARLHATGTPADLSVTNPLSFMPLTSRMFVAVVLFHAALGFSVTFGGSGTLLSPEIALVFFACLLAYSLVRGSRSIDTLYGLAYLLTLAGLLLVPALLMGDGNFTEVSSALCEISSSLFALVMWYLVARIGARSPAGALPVLCMVRSARGLGLALGLVSGMYATGVGMLDEFSIAVLAAGVALVFAAFNFNFARSFSFDATVRGIHPLVEGVRVVAEPPAAVAGVSAVEGAVSESAQAVAGTAVVAEGPAPTGQLDLACEALARECRLTARESDVLAMLARGRNAAYIQQELSLTRNTVKSYVADVYRKLNVHSHQELIDLVEGER